MTQPLPELNSHSLIAVLDVLHSGEFIRVIKGIKSLKDLAQKVDILTKVNAQGENVLALALTKCPGRMPDLLELIGTMPVVVQEKIFSHKSTHIPYLDKDFCGQKEHFNALGLIAVICPQVYPQALELIWKFSFQTQTNLFSLTQDKNQWRHPLFLRVAERAPEVIPQSLKVLKKFPKEIQEATIYKKKNNGQGLVGAIILSGNTTVLKEVVAMGFIFEKNKYLELLLEVAEANHLNMLKVLVSDFGLTPDPAIIEHVADTVMYLPDDRAFAGRVVNFFKDTEGLDALYNSYLNTLLCFVTAEIDSAMVQLKYNIPAPVISIISAYLLNDPAMVESIECARNLRVGLLSPLFDYSLRNDSDVAAKDLLNKLVGPRTLFPLSLEQELNKSLTEEGFSGKAYKFSIIKCRLNTAELTKNKFIPLGGNKVIHEAVALKLKNQQESSAFMFKILCSCVLMSAVSVVLSFLALNVGMSLTGDLIGIAVCSAAPILDLQLPSESFAFQFAVLRVSTILNCIGLILGLVMLCAVNVVVTPLTIAAVAASTVALAGNAYGFYARKKNMEVQGLEDEAQALLSAVPA